MQCGGKQDSSSKESTIFALSTAGVLELGLSFLTDLWLHGMYGLLTRKAQDLSQLGSLTKPTFVCIWCNPQKQAALWPSLHRGSHSQKQQFDI